MQLFYAHLTDSKVRFFVIDFYNSLTIQKTLYRDKSKCCNSQIHYFFTLTFEIKTESRLDGVVTSTLAHSKRKGHRYPRSLVNGRFITPVESYGLFVP